MPLATSCAGSRRPAQTPASRVCERWIFPARSQWGMRHRGQATTLGATRRSLLRPPGPQCPHRAEQRASILGSHRFNRGPVPCLPNRHERDSVLSCRWHECITEKRDEALLPAGARPRIPTPEHGNRTHKPAASIGRFVRWCEKRWRPRTRHVARPCTAAAKIFGQPLARANGGST